MTDVTISAEASKQLARCFTAYGRTSSAKVEAVIRDLLAQIAAKEVEIAGLRELLEPFAKAADVKLCGEWRDDEAIGRTDTGFYVKFGDLRKARAALKTQEGEKS